MRAAIESRISARKCSSCSTCAAVRPRGPRGPSSPRAGAREPSSEARYTSRVATRDDWQHRLGPLYGGAVALVHSTSWRWPIEVGEHPRAASWLVALGVPIGALAWLVAALVHGAGLPATIGALFGLGALSAASAALVERGVGGGGDTRER